MEHPQRHLTDRLRDDRDHVRATLDQLEVYFDGAPPPSVLQVPGAIDCTVEFHGCTLTVCTTTGIGLLAAGALVWRAQLVSPTANKSATQKRALGRTSIRTSWRGTAKV